MLHFNCENTGRCFLARSARLGSPSLSSLGYRASTTRFFTANTNCYVASEVSFRCPQNCSDEVGKDEEALAKWCFLKAFTKLQFRLPFGLDRECPRTTSYVSLQQSKRYSI
jgi:hypothetical protein